MSEAEERNFETALAAWVVRTQQNIIEDHDRRYPGSKTEPRKLSVDPGGVKFVRIVATDGPSRSAFAFVEKSTGDLFKPDGWKRPAKGARGNIYRDTQGIVSNGQLYR